METLEIFGLQFVLSLIVYTLIARWYAAPWLAGKALYPALMLLILPHASRHIGLSFFVPGLNTAPLPDAFAFAAAYGDLISGLLAITALIALRRSWGFALPLVWLFNLIGTADLLNPLRQADVVPYFAATWFIPTFLVPILLVTHTMIFIRLLKHKP